MNEDWGYGPFWIDPQYSTAPAAPAVSEEQIRRIVREEIANLPIQFDIPDSPPDV